MVRDARIPAVHAGRAAAAGDLQARLIGDPTVREDPTGLFADIRARGPVTKGRLAAITVDHAIVHEVLRSDDFRTIVLGSRLPGPLGTIERRTRSEALQPAAAPPSLWRTEPPEHTSYRKMVSSVFTARAVAAMRDNVEETARRLLDDLDGAAGTVDIVERYCARLPVTVIGDILGVPESDRDQVLHFGELAAPSLDLGLPWGQFRRVERGIEGFNEWLADHLAMLRRSPGDDLMSQLISATDNGVSLTDEELRGIAGLVLAAGSRPPSTSSAAASTCSPHHPDQLALLRDDPSLWSNAVDEMLRLRSPVALTARSAVRPTEVGGVSFQRSELIVLVLAGANRDPAVFADPDRFDVTRANANRHHSFSGGRHFCLGAALARAETEVGLRALFDRYPTCARRAHPSVATPVSCRATRRCRSHSANAAARGPDTDEPPADIVGRGFVCASQARPSSLRSETYLEIRACDKCGISPPSPRPASETAPTKRSDGIRRATLRLLRGPVGVHERRDRRLPDPLGQTADGRLEAVDPRRVVLDTGDPHAVLLHPVHDAVQRDPSSCGLTTL